MDNLAHSCIETSLARMLILSILSPFVADQIGLLSELSVLTFVLSTRLSSHKSSCSSTSSSSFLVLELLNFVYLGVCNFCNF
jgi:hypothetical protein